MSESTWNVPPFPNSIISGFVGKGSQSCPTLAIVLHREKSIGSEAERLGHADLYELLRPKLDRHPAIIKLRDVCSKLATAQAELAAADRASLRAKLDKDEMLAAPNGTGYTRKLAAAENAFKTAQSNHITAKLALDILTKEAEIAEAVGDRVLYGLIQATTFELSERLNAKRRAAELALVEAAGPILDDLSNVLTASRNIGGLTDSLMYPCRRLFGEPPTTPPAPMPPETGPANDAASFKRSEIEAPEQET